MLKTLYPLNLKRNQKGVTLPELLLATLILALALSSIVLLFVRCSNLNEANRNLTLSATHAQYIMEEMQNTTFSNLQALIASGHWNWTTIDITSKGFSPLNNETTTVQASGTTPLTATATVNWNDRTGLNRSYSLSSIFQ
ncbi:MAG: prepilin-type N-terminal cleavage/methylation domain-containing protein [Candidatus Aceula lacicola]|nr:prepilin-type N-terminal cleavage/methylation domain-containing protein [Candidatus Aceula lacicola]